MKLTRTLQAVAVVAANGSCFLLPQEEATLTVDVASSAISLDDRKGPSWLEVHVGGAIYPERLFLATGDAFVVPDFGTATVAARLVQDGQTVAGGTREWGLEPEIQWTLVVERGLQTSADGAVDRTDKDFDDEECFHFWCHRKWRFPIVEDAANYENEALWLYLNRWHPGQCQDIC